MKVVIKHFVLKLVEHNMKLNILVSDIDLDNCLSDYRRLTRYRIEMTHDFFVTGEYKFSCEICNKGFQIKSYLTIHMKVHSDVKPFTCNICGIAIKSKQALIDHENRHLGVKAYKCTTCDQKFISKSLCLAHEKTHMENNVVTKYPCSVCNKLFVRRAYLKIHMTIHNGNKPFICDVSTKYSFTESFFIDSSIIKKSTDKTSR